jgi:hypothetical protein
MWTFGLAMIIGNLAFVYPEHVRAAVTWLARGRDRKSLAESAKP